VRKRNSNTCTIKPPSTPQVADKKEAKTVLYQHAIKPFVCPGDPGWGLGGMFPNAANREESDSFKAYFKQARTELSERLLDVIYGADGAHNKWWMCFVKRKFMGKELRN
jgi:actin related protein 2/3 complex, subunit 3